MVSLNIKSILNILKYLLRILSHGLIDNLVKLIKQLFIFNRVLNNELEIQVSHSIQESLKIFKKIKINLFLKLSSFEEVEHNY